VVCRSHLDFPPLTVEDSGRSPTCSAALSHNNRQDLSLGVRRRQERRRARLSLVSPNNSSSSPLQADLCSVILSSHRRGDRYLGVASSLHSPLVDCLEARRPSSSPLKAGLYSGALQLNQLKVVGFSAHNSPLNNNREDPFSAAHNNRLSSREPLSLGIHNNPLPDRRHRSLGRHNSSLPPGLHCSVIPNSRRQDPRCLEIPSPQYLAPPPLRLSLSSNHPLWERRSVRNLTPQLTLTDQTACRIWGEPVYTNLE